MMKKVIKVSVYLLGILFLVWATLTLAQAATFPEVWELEKGFVKGVIESPSVWLGTIVLWKNLIFALALVVVLVELFIFAIVQLVRVCYCKRCTKVKEPRAVVAATSNEARATKKETANGVVMSSRTRTSNPGRFTRVHKDRD